MADTKHARVGLPVEGDGVSYRAIGWFLGVLVVTVVVCQVLVWGLFRFTVAYRLNRPEVVRAPLAMPAGEPTLESGRVVTGLESEPQPALLVSEPLVLDAFRQREETELHSYGWVNQGTGIVRLPIDRAKELLLERGLPTREATAAPAAAGE